jgi:hypothetical protein
LDICRRTRYAVGVKMKSLVAGALALVVLLFLALLAVQ